VSRDIDWKETEWIVTQLRAKLAEDAQNSDGEPAAEPSQETLAEYRANKRKKNKKNRKQPVPAAPVEEATPIEEAAPVEEAAPAEEVAPVEEAAPAKEKSAPPARGLFVEDDKAPPAAQAEPAGRASATEEAATDSESGAPAIAAPAQTAYIPVPPQKRTALFAASYQQEPQPAAFASAPKKSGQKRKNSTAPLSARTEEEMRAELTVEHLMQDLFGTDATDWFGKEEAAAKPAPAPEKSAEKPAAPGPSAPSFQESEKPAPKKTKRRAAAGVAEEPIENFETITREQDGQMAMVLPETGKPLAIPAGERESKQIKEKGGSGADEAQIDLFSGALTDENQLDPDSGKDKNEFKRSIETSDEDFEMLLDLDYENELGTAIGFEKIRLYHEKGVNGPEAKRRRRRQNEKREYELQSQDTSLRKYYTKQKSEHVFRLILSLALTALLFLYEQSGWMARLFGGPFDGARYPASYILIGMQILLIAAYFSRQRLIEGFVRILRFSPIDYSLCSVVLIVTVLYHTVLLFLKHDGAPTLYLSPAAMSLALLALADLFDWYRESLAFQVVSSRKQKYALIPRASVGGKQGDARARLEEDDKAGTVWYVRPVGFVRNYFANTEKRVEHGRSLGIQLLLILAIGLSFGLYVFAVEGSAEALFQTVFLTFLFCAPMTSLLVTSLPMFFASVLRLNKKGAIIGEQPVFQCGEPTTLVVPDAEVFGAMHHERFEVVDEDHPDDVVVWVRALLEKLQSPLTDSVSVERDRRIPPSAVFLCEICEDGVSATVGPNRIPMLIGSVSYLQERGIAVQARPEYDFEQSGKRLVCVAAQGKIAALFLARYRLNDDMLELLRELEGEDVKIMIRTKDPGIHDELFRSLLPDRGEPVGVMKPTAKETDLRTDRVDATVVALGSCREAARTFVTCRRVRRAGALGRMLQALSVTIGAVIIGMTALFGNVSNLIAIGISGYMLLWSGIHALTSYFYLRDRNDNSP